MSLFNALPVRRVEEHPLAPMDRGSWPATLAPVQQILDAGLALSPVTVLLGDNGSGKSTIVEALAAAFGLNPEGGTHAARHETRATESMLVDHLQLVRGAGASKRGVFLRAETIHGHFSYLESIGASNLHDKSHGEAFLDFVTALSFSECLTLIGLLRELKIEGSQIVLATHSPILAALPEAQLYEIGSGACANHRMRNLNWYKTGPGSLTHRSDIYAISTDNQPP